MAYQPPRRPGEPPRAPVPPDTAPLNETPSAALRRRGPISEQLHMRRELEQRIHAELEAKRAVMKQKLLKAGAIAGSVAVVALVAWLVFRPPVECRRGAERARAFDALRGIKEPQSGNAALARFDDEMFHCIDTAEPAGTLIAVRENPAGGEESMIWFVPSGGPPQSVNLLADAWTPRLGAGPEFPDSTLDRVTR